MANRNTPRVRFFGGNDKKSIFRFSRSYLFFFRSRDGLTILKGGEEDLEGFSWFVFFLLFIIEIKNGSFLFFYGHCM